MTISGTPKGFDLPQKPELPDHFTSDSLTTYVDFWEQVKEICDWHIGQALVQAKKDLGHGNFMAWYEARGWTSQHVSNLSKWYSDPDIPRLAKFEIEKNTSRFARRELVKAHPAVKQAVSNHVSETNENVSAARIAELESQLRVSDIHAKKSAEFKREVERLNKELKGYKSGEIQPEAVDPAVARRNLARDLERAMTFDAGTRRQEIERYFDLRDLFTEEGRIYMDNIVKRLFISLSHNLTETGDPK